MSCYTEPLVGGGEGGRCGQDGGRGGHSGCPGHHGLRDADVRVPEGVAVVAFDDIETVIPPVLPPVLPWSVPVLVAHARALVVPGQRRLLGLAGAPGAGKSTLAAKLCAALGPVATRVPMDGFHLANRVLAELGLADRKGSPASFDAAGFQALLRRLRVNTDEVVYAPEFLRELEEPIAGALPVPCTVPLVIVEGNYLLLDDGPWRGTAALLDEIWYLRPQETVRRRRLVARHRRYGRSAAEAEAWVAGNDDPNARLIATTTHRAHRIIG